MAGDHRSFGNRRSFLIRAAAGAEAVLFTTETQAFPRHWRETCVAQDDAAFVRSIPRNSWGGASQALTALRAPRWMIHYGKQTELNYLMRQWCEAIVRDGAFRQQLDPATGIFTRPDPGGYSPAALVFLEFARRLGMNQRPARIPA